MKARYLLCPGVVPSRTDGDRHFIGASELAALYGVRMAACLILPEDGHRADPQYRWLRQQLLARADRGELIALRPRRDGKYNTPARGTQSTPQNSD
ncbi:hypothetical protein [Delftia sp. ZNC0008]|uniref:hypothetical protein n=1 Tax=Delftia sp. ZNC0008 TaxID=1339242 RepID=UPI0012DFF27D|nr:hypothetical protein [Delftia sp. ZNC0008]